MVRKYFLISFCLLATWLPLSGQKNLIIGLNELLKGATPLGNGVWICNQEVSVQEYEHYLYYLVSDSGQVMFSANLPQPDFAAADQLGGSSRWPDMPGTPVESGHPVAAITWQNATDYCIWLSAISGKVQWYMNRKEPAWLEYAGKNRKYDDPFYFHFIRFRLPTPEEWTRAEAIAHQQKLRKQEYSVAPSRFLHTRPITSARPGEKLLHLDDNVSEWTTQPGIAMGGNFEQKAGPGARQEMEPGFQTGFRLVIELDPERPPVKSWAFRRDYLEYDDCAQISRSEKVHLQQCYDSWVNDIRVYRFNYFIPEEAPRPLYDLLYPFPVKELCEEISPGLWISKTPVTVEQYEYFLHHSVEDSGEFFMVQNVPLEFRPKVNCNGNALMDSIRKSLPPDRNQWMTGTTWKQANSFCNYLTHFNVFTGCRLFRYRFRLPTEAEWKLADSLSRGSKSPGFNSSFDLSGNRTEWLGESNLLIRADGSANHATGSPKETHFHFILEIMPDPPHFKNHLHFPYHHLAPPCHAHIIRKPFLPWTPHAE